MKRSTIKKKARALRNMLEALVEVNVDFLRRHAKSTGKQYPSIYDVKPNYSGAAQMGMWQTIPAVVETGMGNACDFVCWRVAELRAAGYKDVRPVVRMWALGDDDDGGNAFFTTVHVRMRGNVEDPVAILSGFGTAKHPR